jgi:hypothetical protein
VKIRCDACGRVAKVKNQLGCPLCGQPLPAAYLGATDAGSLSGAGPWGELPTRRSAVALVTVILLEGSLLATFLYLAYATGEDSGIYWVLAILAMIALIPVGIWLERRTIRGEKSQ